VHISELGLIETHKNPPSPGTMGVVPPAPSTLLQVISEMDPTPEVSPWELEKKNMENFIYSYGKSPGIYIYYIINYIYISIR